MDGMLVLALVVLGVFGLWGAWAYVYARTQYPLDKRLHDVTRR